MTQYVQAPANITTRVSGTGGPITTAVAANVQVRQARFDEHAGIGGQVPGTFSNGIVVTTPNNSVANTRVMKYPDANYNAIIALSANAFSADTVTTTITTEAAESPTFLPPNYFNTGLHKQLCIMNGDSIFASGVGATLYNGVGNVWNFNFMQPVVSKFYTPSKSTWGGYYNLTDGTASSGLQATIGGTITAGNTPSLTFTSSALAGSPITIPYTVQAGDSTTLIAAGLAANINANATLAAAGISATSALAVITLTLPEPPTFTPALQTTKTNSGTATITLAAQLAVNPAGSNKYVAVTGPSADFNDYAYTNQRVKQFSRFCLGMARGGWFMFELAGATGREDGTVTTGGWVNNQPLLKGLHFSSYQQVVFVIELGTNDFNYNAQSGTNGLVPLFGSPTQGTPNLVTNGLTPLITAYKALAPNCKIVVVTPHARDFGDNTYNAYANAQFVNYAAYLQANKASLGVDAIVDARTLAGGVYDPGNYVTNTGSVWTRDGWNARYLDGVHQTPFAITNLYAPAVTAALDALWPG